MAGRPTGAACGIMGQAALQRAGVAPGAAMGRTAAAMDMAPVLSFGSVLRRHRVAAGLSQDELAERAAVSRRSISDMERGVPRRPHPETITLLAEALALSGAERAAFVVAARQLR